MKTRIISAVAALALLFLVAQLAPALFENAGLNGAGSPSGLTSAKMLQKVHSLREKWAADTRTAQAMICYLLEPELPPLTNTLVASNSTNKDLLVFGISSLPTS